MYPAGASYKFAGDAELRLCAVLIDGTLGPHEPQDAALGRVLNVIAIGSSLARTDERANRAPIPLTNTGQQYTFVSSEANILRPACFTVVVGKPF